MITYNEQQKEKCFSRIRDICRELPSYCTSYINTVSTKKDTSFRTGMQYAYEIRTFINFMAIRESVNPKDISASMLEALLPMEIDDYISGLSSYETLEDREYNEIIKKEQMEAHGKKHYSLAQKEKRHGKSAAARARSLAAVRGLYKYLQKNGMISANPAALTDMPLKPKKPVITLDPEEVNQTIYNAQNSNLKNKRQVQFSRKQSLRDTALLMLLFYTGIRASEWAGLNIQDIDMVTCSARVLRKGGNYEDIFYNAEVRDVIQAYIDNERKDPEVDRDALFVGRFGDRLSTQSINNIVKKYTNGVSLQHITTHKLRATYATALYEQTGDAMLVKDALGHSTLGVVQKYIASSEKNRKRAGEIIRYNMEK